MTLAAPFENRSPSDAPAQCRAATSGTFERIQAKPVAAHNPGVIIAVLCLMSLLHATFLLSFYAPAHGGTDQNGYQVTARLISEGKGASFRPTSSFTFVGNMMVLMDDGRVYAKYPPGYPLLAAIARLVGGSKAVYLVNPICMAGACAFSFLLFRAFLSEFTSLCAVLWLSWNPLVLFYANDANSHASTLLCTIIGCWGLISWLGGSARWRGVLGGVCLGYAATIRYSELLLVLPVLLAVAMHLCESQRPGLPALRRSSAVLLGWAVPVGVLACFCWSAFGAPWKTGYSYCAEDSGFGWKYLVTDPVLHRQGNWETLLVQMNWMGLFMLWPIGLFGLVILITARPRKGACIALWALPPTILYLCYYWAPTGENSLGYLRFFLTIIPALILGALWVLENAIDRAGTVTAIGLGLLTAIGVCVNVWNILPALETSLATRQALAHVEGFIESRVPQGSSLFIADEGLSNCLDATGGYDLYNLQLFRNSSFAAFNRIMDDPTKTTEPDPRQRKRIALYWRLLDDADHAGGAVPKSNRELMRSQDHLINDMLNKGAGVFVLLKTGQNKDMLPDDAQWTSTLVDTDVSYPNVPVAQPVGNRDSSARAHADEVWFPNPVTWAIYQIARQ
jgi:hypothetical protein